MSSFYPVFLRLDGRLCLVVGGGVVAERKVLSLLESGAKVNLVSREVTPLLHSLAAGGKIFYRRGEYTASDLEGVFLAIGATSDQETNRRLDGDCCARNILVNIVDEPDLGSFHVPARVIRGSLQIAVSTGGKSPLLARKIKEELAGRYGPRYGDLAELLGEIREEAKVIVKDHGQRAALLAGLVDDEVCSLMREGLWEKARERVIKNANPCCRN
jgi:precorrin-2 dehydrogenase/sirohydrochlorin ferrochelatase